jgi:hypothetical protein
MKLMKISEILADGFDAYQLSEFTFEMDTSTIGDRSLAGLLGSMNKGFNLFMEYVP